MQTSPTPETRDQHTCDESRNGNDRIQNGLRRLTGCEAINRLRDHPFELSLDPTNSRVQLTHEQTREIGPELTIAVEDNMAEITRWILFRRAVRYLDTKLDSLGNLPATGNKHIDPEKEKVFSGFMDYLGDPDNVDCWYGDQTSDFKKLLVESLEASLPKPVEGYRHTNKAASSQDSSEQARTTQNEGAQATTNKQPSLL